MSITIRYFGAIAEQTGCTEELLELDIVGTDIAQLKAYCVRKHQLTDDNIIQIAVNQQLNQTGSIKDGDEVALLPPFAGG
ncbi:MAG: MoaD/ThiS family protein [Marinoscillum sp.]